MFGNSLSSASIQGLIMKDFHKMRFNDDEDDEVDDDGDGDDDDGGGDDGDIEPDGGRSKGTGQNEESKEQAEVLLHPEILDVSFLSPGSNGNGTVWICS